MSIASRKRSCDLRASASAASISARLRAISPAAANGLRPRLAGGLGADFTGRPRKRIIAACLGFPAVLRFFVDIATLTPRITADGLWDKCLKKWYLLACKHLAANLIRCRPENPVHALRVSILT